MPDGEQMNPVLFHPEGVNDPVVAHASSNACVLAHLNKRATNSHSLGEGKTIRSLQPMMWKRFEAQSDFIDFRFDPCTDSGWQLEENGIETCVVNLSRRAHEPFGSRTRAAFPAAMSRSDR